MKRSSFLFTAHDKLNVGGHARGSSVKGIEIFAVNLPKIPAEFTYLSYIVAKLDEKKKKPVRFLETNASVCPETPFVLDLSLVPIIFSVLEITPRVFIVEFYEENCIYLKTNARVEKNTCATNSILAARSRYSRAIRCNVRKLGAWMIDERSSG